MKDKNIFEIVYHSDMLNDINRNENYKKSITKETNPDDIIVDIGAGTGFLSMISASISKKVFSIEHQKSSSDIFKNIIYENNIENVQVINNASFKVDLVSENPTVIVTETMGIIGLDEDIVESTYDFCKRHSCIKKVIPKKISIKAQFANFKAIDAYKKYIIGTYQDTYCLDSEKNHKTIEYLKKSLDDSMTGLYDISFFEKYGGLEDVDFINNEIELSSYNLGTDFDSSFEKEISVPIGANCLFIYFTAYLNSEYSISNSPHKEITHWGIPLFFINKNKYVIAYDSRIREILLKKQCNF